MAVANAAWVLASNGFRVLMVDWDLEAPGLHGYFHPFLIDKKLEVSPGVVDLVWNFSNAVMSRPDDEGCLSSRRENASHSLAQYSLSR